MCVCVCVCVCVNVSVHIHVFDHVGVFACMCVCGCVCVCVCVCQCEYMFVPMHPFHTCVCMGAHISAGGSAPAPASPDCAPSVARPSPSLWEPRPITKGQGEEMPAPPPPSLPPSSPSLLLKNILLPLSQIRHSPPLRSTLG